MPSPGLGRSGFPGTLIVIRRAYAYLQDELLMKVRSELGVHIVIDRRQGERRMTLRPVDMERRAGERRRHGREVATIILPPPH